MSHVNRFVFALLLNPGHERHSEDSEDDPVGGGSGSAGAAAPSSTAAASSSKSAWHELGVIEEAGNTFLDAATGARLGRIHVIGDGGAKATCAQHKSCACWLTKKVDANVVFADLVTWLSSALSLGKEAHVDRATELKRSHGMRVRG